MQVWSVLLLILLIVLVGILSVGAFLPLGPWTRAKRAGAPVSLGALVGMRVRKVPPDLIVEAYLRLQSSTTPAALDAVVSVYEAHRREITSGDDLVRLLARQAGNQAV